MKKLILNSIKMLIFGEIMCAILDVRVCQILKDYSNYWKYFLSWQFIIAIGVLFVVFITEGNDIFEKTNRENKEKINELYDELNQIHALKIKNLKDNSIKVGTIECTVSIDKGNPTYAMVTFKTDDDRIMVLRGFYECNEIDKLVIEELERKINNE